MTLPMRTWDDAYGQPAQSLAIFRMLFGVALLALLLPRFQWIAGFPDDFFDPPPGPTWFFAGFPPRSYFLAVDALLITASVFLVAGRLVTPASLAISAGLLAGDAWAYSFGKIDHDILLVLLPAFMAAAGWHGRGPSRAWPIASYALVVSLAMAVGAWQKLSSGWLDPSANAVLGHNVVFSADSDAWVWRAAIRHLPSIGWKVLDYGTIAFESAFILVVWKAGAFRALCGVACIFHIVVGQLMRITFLSNLPAYAAFVDWADLSARARAVEPIERVQRWLDGRTTWQLIAVSAATCLVYLRWGNAVRLATTMLGPEHELLPRMVTLWLAAAFGAGLLLIRLTRRTRMPPSDRLRIATADDAPAVARLINLAFRVENSFKAGERTSPEGVVALMGTGEFLVLDGSDGGPVVAVYVTRNDGRGYFGMLSVDPGLQGQGLAKQVIAEVEDRCRRQGCHTMDIYVVDLRTELPDYYRRLGYAESGTRDFPEPTELTRPARLIVMSKALS